MGSRNFAMPRCKGCGLHQELCVCDQMPQIELGTKVLVIQNNHERNKPTNTGRLVKMLLPNCELIYYAVRGEEFDPTPLQLPNCDYRLLFPRPEGSCAAKDWQAPKGQSQTLVVLDGTWAQCSRMSHRVPVVGQMPGITFSDTSPSRWGVRQTLDPSRMSTLEATIRALADIEGQQKVAPMRDYFHLVAARMQFMKARLPSPEVPPEWN